MGTSGAVSNLLRAVTVGIHRECERLTQREWQGYDFRGRHGLIQTAARGWDITWRVMAMDTFLPAIEKPQGLVMKLAYAMTRRQFGKVLTPVKVAYSRLPAAFAMFSAKISKLEKKLELPAEMVMLVREQVARINVCEFCMDIGRSIAIKESMNEAKFDALDEYRTSPFFSEAERAALDSVTELTREKKVEPETFARMARHYSERAICEIVWVVATEHYYNLTNIGLNIHSDMLCDSSRRKNVALA